jgi:hypothetical protein
MATLAILVAGFATLTFLVTSFSAGSSGSLVRFFVHDTRLDQLDFPPNAQEILDRCAGLESIPVVPQNFRDRESSERYEYGNNATLIRDATIFTGKNNGKEIIRGDILLDRGVVKGVGWIPARVIDEAENLTVLEAHGAWITPGLGAWMCLLR